MRWAQGFAFVCSLLLIVALQTRIISIEGYASRELQQRSLEPNIVVHNALELQEAFSRIQANETIFLDSDQPIRLRRTLIISTPGITLRGGGASRTTLRCPSDSSTGAFLVKSVDVRIEDMTVQDCNGAPVLEIDADDRRDGSGTNVSLQGVTFMRNGLRNETVNGTAIREHSCSKDDCVGLRIVIDSCHFEQNHGQYGGAIFTHHADVSIRNSTFVRNRASFSGGAISFPAHGRELVIEDSKFEGNEAMGHGVVNLTSSMQQLQTLEGTGGAIFTVNPGRVEISGSTFLQNVGCAGGGALEVQYVDKALSGNASAEFRMESVRFEENKAFCDEDGAQTGGFPRNNRDVFAGGALDFTDSRHGNINWLVQNCTFLRNRARVGGGMYLMGAIDTPLDLRDSVFDENTASSGGGALNVKSAWLRMSATELRRGRSVYGGGIMLWTQGRLDIVPGSEDPSHVSTIEDNVAVYGGGIQYSIAGDESAALVGLNRIVLPLGEMNLSSLVVRNNTAFRYGGGIRCFTASRTLTFNGITVANNTAMVGGGVSFLSVSSFNMISDRNVQTSITGNTASVGGGMYYESRHYLPIEANIRNATFADNRALLAEHEDIDDLIQAGNDYRVTESSLPHQAFGFIRNFEEQTVVDVLTTVPAGHGGGLCMSFTDITFITVAEVQFQNVKIDRNEASVGGGGSFHFAELFWNKGRTLHCFPPVAVLEACQRFYMSNVSIQHNKADYAGGLFTTHPEYMIMACDLEKPKMRNSLKSIYSKQHRPRERLSQTEDLECLKIMENSNKDGRDDLGVDVGTSAKSLAIDSLFGEMIMSMVASGDPLAIPCAADPQNLTCREALVVSVKDAFNQTISHGIQDSSLDLSVLASNIAGEVRYTAENGTALINNTVARGIGVNCSLTIQSDRDPRIRVRARFSTRECHPGEFEGPHNCQPCPTDSYSFFPELKECRPCEDKAICKGQASLVPQDGFWHSTPFSPQFHPCIMRSSCVFDGRQGQLEAFYNDSSRLTKEIDTICDPYGNITLMETLNFTSYQQCAPGSDGPLCGSCQAGYGHGLSGACEVCPSEKGTAHFLLGVVLFWTIVLIGVNCLVTLLSARARIQLVRFEAKNQTMNPGARVLRRTEQHIQETNTFRSRLSRNNTVSGTSTISDVQCRQSLTQQLVATVQLTETYKILVNYFQVTSSAMRLPVDWSCSMNNLLSIQVGVVGVTSEAVSVPMECNFDEEYRLPPSIWATLLRIAIPIAAVWLLIVAYWLFWLLIRRRSSECRENRTACRRDLVTGVIVIFIVAVYFSYIDNVRQFLRSINCVDVDAADADGSHPYQKFAVHVKKRVWAEDTELTCFKGDHLMTGILGVVGLMLSFLVVVFIMTWQRLNKRHDTEADFVARYWFIYQAYKKEWHTTSWEAFILIRKAAIAAVLVFSYRLEPSLQATICVGVLIVAYALQTTLQPFRVHEDHIYVPEYAGAILKSMHAPKLALKWIQLNNGLSLNGLESASLLSSILVFYTASVIADDGVSRSGIDAMTGVAVATNISFVLYMLYRLYCGVHVCLDLKLEHDNPGLVATQDNGHGVLHLVRKMVYVVQGTFHNYVNRRRETDERAEATPTESEDGSV